MSNTGLAVFDATLQKTHHWLGLLMKEFATDDQHLAYLGLRATLHALRDRLPPELAVHLGAQLPMLVRGFFYEGWRPSECPSREHDWQAFLERIRRELPPDLGGRAAQFARAVVRLLAQEIDPGETAKVFRSLPRAIRDELPVPEEL